jgi:uncharacterized integral membrane protein
MRHGEHAVLGTAHAPRAADSAWLRSLAPLEGSMSMASKPKQPANEKWRPTTRQIIAAVIVVVALVFILQNTRTAHFNFL